jgi:hemerythrin HHE cation binding domain-containing protein
MTAAVLPRTTSIPSPRRPMDDVAASAPDTAVRSTAAVAYERVLHQTVRREFRLLADLAAWADADDVSRIADLTRHADLLGRLLLQHHTTERHALWPALFRHLPAGQQDAARALVADWTSRAALLDHDLRDLSTAARQWAVAQTVPARDAFVRACRRVASAVDAHTAAEEAGLLPLLARHLPDREWLAIRRAAHTCFTGREQMLVLGLALEDACALDRARLLAGLSPAARTAWRVFGRRDFHSAVVRLRGAPPAA